MTLVFEIFSLLVFFQLKHFIADYPLQGKYMLQKFKPDWDFFVPLLAHASVHALFTLAVCLWLAPHLWWLALVDLAVHFVMDRAKAGPKYLGRYKALFGKQFQDATELANDPEYNGRTFKMLQKEARKQLKHNTYFWWSLGFDQMIHHFTDLFIIYVIVMY